MISSLCISKPYHVVGVHDLVLLVAQLPHDVVARVLRLVGHAVHHAQSVRLVLGVPVEVQHALAVRHLIDLQ